MIAELDIQPQQEEDHKSHIMKEFTVKWMSTIKPLRPFQLKNHSAIPYKGSLYIFGGYDGTRNHDTLFAFNLATQELTLVTTIGTVPKRRNGHSATLVGKFCSTKIGDKLYVIGGWLGAGPLAAFDICVLDMEALEWFQPDYLGESPGACNMHTADLYKGQIYVFRGGNGRDYLNDLHALNVRTFAWRKVNAKGKYPPERANHSSSLMGNKLYIFGGWNGYKRLNDMHMIDLGIIVQLKIIIIS